MQSHPEWNILDADELIEVEKLVSTIPSLSCGVDLKIDCMDKERTLAAIQAVKK